MIKYANFTRLTGLFQVIMTKTIQYITGVGAGAISYSAFLLLRYFPKPLFVPLILLVWLGALFALYLSMSKRALWKHNILFISISTVLTMTGFIFVVEQASLRNYLMMFIAALIGLLYGWGTRYEHDVVYTAKPFRRYIMMLWVFNVYALATFIFALKFFFPTGMFQLFWLKTHVPLIAGLIPQGLSFVVLIVLAGIFTGVISVIIWKMYYMAELKSFLIWGALVSLVTMELMWMIHLLPFDYAVLGFLLTWIWYVVQLFVRFHFSKKGINWKTQKHFLIINGLLFALFLIFFVRWV